MQIIESIQLQILSPADYDTDTHLLLTGRKTIANNVAITLDASERRRCSSRIDTLSRPPLEKACKNLLPTHRSVRRMR